MHAEGRQDMRDRGHEFSEEDGLHKFRTEIPNTVIRGLKSRGLSVHAKWLYVYFKSVCGDKAECYRTTSTIAEESGLSRTMVSTGKKELIDKGLIVLTRSKNPNRQPDHVRIKNIWDANMQEFSVPLANALNEEDVKEIKEEETNSVPLANADSGQRSISERSVPLANTSVLLANQRRSQEEDPSQEVETSHPPTPLTGNGVCVRELEVVDTTAAAFTPYTPGFRDLCAVYPASRQEGTQEAYAIWLSRDLEPHAQDICAKVRLWVEGTWSTRETRYIPLMKTWLEKGRYNDVPPPVDQGEEAKAVLGKAGYQAAKNAERLLKERKHGHDGRPGTRLLPSARSHE